MNFSQYDKIFAQSKDMNKLYNLPYCTKFLIVRSLSKHNLCEYLQSPKTLVNRGRDICFDEKPTDEIIEYVCKKKSCIELSDSKRTELTRNICQIKDRANRSSVHEDNFNSNINKIVRSSESYDELLKDMNGTLFLQLQNYMTWQWYNQRSSDLIEDIILKQSCIVPTLRKIKNVDFFMRLKNNDLFPFDLKTTIFPAGFYKQNKLETTDITEYLKDVSNQERIVTWMYSEQNPRLFSNNYRMFVILVNSKDIAKSFQLKSNMDLISGKIIDFFEKVSDDDIVDIEYTYKKDRSLAGEYTTKCMYLFVSV